MTTIYFKLNVYISYDLTQDKLVQVEYKAKPGRMYLYQNSNYYKIKTPTYNHLYLKLLNTHFHTIKRVLHNRILSLNDAHNKLTGNKLYFSLNVKQKDGLYFFTQANDLIHDLDFYYDIKEIPIKYAYEYKNVRLESGYFHNLMVIQLEDNIPDDYVTVRLCSECDVIHVSVCPICGVKGKLYSNAFKYSSKYGTVYSCHIIKKSRRFLAYKDMQRVYLIQ
jgi:hypothetical protein